MNIIIYNKKRCLYHLAVFLLTIFTPAVRVVDAPVGGPDVNHVLRLNVDHTSAEAVVAVSLVDVLDVHLDVVDE